MYGRSLHGNREISSSITRMMGWSASGRRGAVADDARAGEVRPLYSSGEAGEQLRRIGGGVGGAKGGGRGEHEQGLDLTRFSGHITVTQRGVQHVEQRQEIYAGVSVPNSTAGTVRSRYEGAHKGVWGFDLVGP